MTRLALALVALAMIVTGAPAGAAEEAAKPAASDHADEKKADKDQSGQLALLPGDSVTHHTFGGRGAHLPYTATAGTLTLRDDKGERSALVFYVAYTLDNAASATRPVSFFFNGGPGAAAAYLHLGAAGPMALDFPAGDPTDGTNAKLDENPDSWLPFTDMVFIDAVGTGWSRPAKPDEAQKQFYGVKQDARAFARIITLWLGHNNRGASPKYLVGESYGGIRSIKVARSLQIDEGVLVDGVVMVSPAIDESLLAAGPDDPLVDALRLPSFAASSLERLHKFDPTAVDDLYRFALGEYLTTMAGPPPTGDAAKNFYGKIAAMIGSPPEIVARRRGTLDISAPELRRHDGRLISRYEGSLTIPDPYPEAESDLPDPILDGFGRAYGGALASYAGGSLGFKTDLPYKLLSYEVNRAWQWGEDGNPDRPNGSEDMRFMLALDPALRIFIASGYFDLICPFSSDRWLIEHLPVGQDRVALHVYPGGHMLYTRPGSRASLADDAAAFYRARTK